MNIKNQQVGGRMRVAGAFTALYATLPVIMIACIYGVTLWLSSVKDAELRALQPHVVLLGLIGLPLVGALLAVILKRQLGAWFARLHYRRRLFGIACGGLAIHIWLLIKVVENPVRREAIETAVRGMIGC